MVICVFFTSFCVGIFGMMHLNDCLSLAELVPRSSAVHDFLEVEFRHFGFTSFTAVTRVGSGVSPCVSSNIIGNQGVS